ncbi:hypothetical protein PInf_001491 [Phytophthora infestans]|nr:hypothetical protein PInf_001491 [Phytophthora infestans]
MTVSRATLLVALGVSYFLFAAAPAAMSEDNPQACKWDIKMCADGTWVYRSAEINCEFDECSAGYQL